MAVTIKSKSEIAIMKEAGIILAKVHKELEKSESRNVNFGNRRSWRKTY